MNPSEFEEFSATLLRTLEANPSVVGLVTLGTTADPSHRDAWSDHDFWVVTQPGRQSALLDDLSWLPAADQILIRVRHGRTHYSVLYRDGHLVEFAVFDSAEAAVGTLATHRVVFDRADVTESVKRAWERTRPSAWDEARRAFTFDNFLVLLHTAVARWHRGERLSARRYHGTFATDALLRLVLEESPRPPASQRDPLDPRRRIERQQPALAGTVESLVCLPVPEGAVGLLNLAQETLGESLTADQRRHAASVRAMLTDATILTRLG